MKPVTVSSKYQIVIPKKIRTTMGIKPGDKLNILKWEGHLVLVPVRDLKTMQGYLKGLDTSVEREKE